MIAMDTITQYAVKYGLQALVAIGIFAAGLLGARWAGNLMQQALERQTLEPPVRMLLVRIVKIIVLLFAAVIALEALGVPIAPLVAGIGVAGVGIGLAMQGVLSNVMAGLSIIFTKPYKVGEHISLLGVHGDVVMVDIFSTILMHSDHSRVVIPNRKIVGEILHNFGTIRQLHFTVDVSYKTDLNQALAIVREIVESHTHVLHDPRAVIGVSRLGQPAITIAIEPWTKVVHYGSLQSELSQAIVERFRAAQIEFPSLTQPVHGR
ncbi:mechanosensitive ion channel family protein [Nitrospira lenta]|uniref:Small-conductance mechanosensitive channel n=1 Tax=Nitrospira lenta TaxID=1436998 RepID=A0A330LAQ0_9BACT|nr:mechanosensitive ion channel family protein [Nitrospira lenta]SPP64036.1 Small-conductance mechanosensitive channel [Nitrospira lenta]